MADQGPHQSRRMKGLPLEEDLPSFPPSPHNPSNEGTTNEYIDHEVGSIALLYHQLEVVIETLLEGSLSLGNPRLTNPLGPTLIELP